MTNREVMQQALEALENLQGGCTDSDDGTVEALTVWCPEVITALREALEREHAMHELSRLGQEIEQEPQAEPCIGKDPRCPCQDGDACHYKDCGDTKALPVPVAQPEQEPVGKFAKFTDNIWREVTDGSAGVPLYATSSPCPTCEALARTVMMDQTAHDTQRPWQGLTDEDKLTAVWTDGTFGGGALWAQARLKERNHG